MRDFQDMFTVETLAITGFWVPKDGIYQMHSFMSAALETFEARLKGQRSRIRDWRYDQVGQVIIEVPPKGDYVSPKQFYSRWPIAKLIERAQS